MLASVLIIVFSVVLFAYWFRYSCLLLLSSRREQRAAISGDFRYSDVKIRLQQEVPLDPLRAELERDYQLLTYLKANAADLNLERVEYRLLAIDFKLMSNWYRLTRRLLPRQARRALVEMADVVGVLVGRIHERVGVHSEI